MKTYSSFPIDELIHCWIPVVLLMNIHTKRFHHPQSQEVELLTTNNGQRGLCLKLSKNGKQWTKSIKSLFDVKLTAFNSQITGLRVEWVPLKFKTTAQSCHHFGRKNHRFIFVNVNFGLDICEWADGWKNMAIFG